MSDKTMWGRVIDKPEIVERTLHRFAIKRLRAEESARTSLDSIEVALLEWLYNKNAIMSMEAARPYILREVRKTVGNSELDLTIEGEFIGYKGVTIE